MDDQIPRISVLGESGGKSLRIGHDPPLRFIAAHDRVDNVTSHVATHIAAHDRVAIARGSGGSLLALGNVAVLLRIAARGLSRLCLLTLLNRLCLLRISGLLALLSRLDIRMLIALLALLGIGGLLAISRLLGIRALLPIRPLLRIATGGLAIARFHQTYVRITSIHGKTSLVLFILHLVQVRWTMR